MSIQFKEIIRVVVFKNDNMYLCEFTGYDNLKIKCGYCQHGIINPFGVRDYDDMCLVCHAKLFSTTYIPIGNKNTDLPELYKIKEYKP